MDIIYSIILALSGLGVLIFGIKTMNKGLENILGIGFKRSLSRASKNNLKSYGLGAGITSVLQTSLLTNSMACGLLDMGAIGLAQGMSIALGACVGSGVAVIIMAFQSIKLVQIFSIFTLIGVFVMIFAKKPKTVHIAQAIIGFGCLCLGLTLIGMGTGQVTAVESVSNFFSTLTNPILLAFLGLVLAIIMHSSMPVLALCIAFCGTADAVGPMTITSALIVIYGAHCGISFIHMALNGFGQTADSRRMLVFDFIARCFGVLLFGLLLLTGWQNWLHSICFSEPSITLVVAVLLVDIVPTLMFLPFVPLFEKIMRKLIKPRKQKESGFEVFDIDEKTLSLPGVAQSSVLKGVSKIFDLELGLTNKIFDLMLDKSVEDKNHGNKFRAIEKVIKLSQNNVIRISGIQGANAEQSSANLLDILNDTNHVLRAVGKISEYEKTIKEKPRLLNKEQMDIVKKVSQSVQNFGNSVLDFMQKSYEQNQSVEPMQKLFEQHEKNIKLSAKAKKEAAKEKTDSIMLLNVLYELDKLNTDFINIAIKTNLMEE